MSGFTDRVASTLHTIVAVKAGEVPPMKNQFLDEHWFKWSTARDPVNI